MKERGWLPDEVVTPVGLHATPGPFARGQRVTLDVP